MRKIIVVLLFILILSVSVEALNKVTLGKGDKKLNQGYAVKNHEWKNTKYSGTEQAAFNYTINQSGFDNKDVTICIYPKVLIKPTDTAYKNLQVKGGSQLTDIKNQLSITTNAQGYITKACINSTKESYNYIKFGTNSIDFNYTSTNSMQFITDYFITNLTLNCVNVSPLELNLKMDGNIMKILSSGTFEGLRNCSYDIETNSTIVYIDNGVYPLFYNYQPNGLDEMRWILDFKDICMKNESNCSVTPTKKGYVVNFTSDKDIDPTYQNISGCTTLNQNNTYYTLNASVSDYVGNCMVFTSVNSTLDGNGYIIDGNDGLYNGVYALGYNNITIKNFANITDFQYGIQLSTTKNNIINNITLASHDNGISIYLTNYTNITNLNLNQNGNGIILNSWSNNNFISNITLISINGGAGIRLLTRSYNNTIANNVIMNGADGIVLDACGQNNILRSNNISNNYNNLDFRSGDNNYYIQDIDTSNIVDYSYKVYYNKSISNYVYDLTSAPDAGMVVCVNCNNISVKNLNLTHYNGHGIFFYNSTNTNIYNVSVWHNRIGIAYDQSLNNNISLIDARYNSDGINILSTSNSTNLTDITANNNIEHGVLLRNINSIVRNINANNNYWGISFVTGYSNIVNNVSANNNSYTGFEISILQNSNISNIISNFNAQYGIAISSSSNITLTNASLISNYRGVYISSSQNITLRNINISNSTLLNFDVFGTIINHYKHDIDTSNTIDNLYKIYYNSSVSNYVYDSLSAPNAAMFVCLDCNNVTIKDQNLSHLNGYGILFFNTTNSLIQNVTATGNSYDTWCDTTVPSNSASNLTYFVNRYCIFKDAESNVSYVGCASSSYCLLSELINGSNITVDINRDGIPDYTLTNWQNGTYTATGTGNPLINKTPYNNTQVTIAYKNKVNYYVVNNAMNQAGPPRNSTATWNTIIMFNYTLTLFSKILENETIRINGASARGPNPPGISSVKFNNSITEIPLLGTTAGASIPPISSVGGSIFNITNIYYPQAYITLTSKRVSTLIAGYAAMTSFQQEYDIDKYSWLSCDTSYCYADCSQNPTLHSPLTFDYPLILNNVGSFRLGATITFTSTRLLKVMPQCNLIIDANAKLTW